MPPVFAWLGRETIHAGAPALHDCPAETFVRGQHCVLSGPSHANDQSCYAAISQGVRWRDSAFTRTSAEHGDAHALIAAYRRHGDQCFAAIDGPFCAVLVDESESILLAAIDRIGRRTLYHTQCADGIVIGESVDALARHPRCDLTIDEQGIFNYVYCHMVPSPSSIYRSVQKLTCGNRLRFHAGRVSVDRYWTPSFHDRSMPDQGLERYAQDLRALLRESLERTLATTASDGKIGAFLSGGLDSSTVVGLLAERQPDDAHSYSIGFDADGYDELPYARISARHFGAKASEYYVTPTDVAEAIPIIAASYTEPFGNSSAIPTYYCARLAQSDGVQTLLAGDGGDEIFAGNERYAKQQVFGLYERVPSALRSILNATAPRLPRVSLIGKAASYVDQARIPLPDRLQTYNLLHRIAPAEVFSDSLLAAADTTQPLEFMRARYHSLDTADAVDRMLYLDWQYTLADSDLRKVTRMCEINGMNVSYPLLDDALVEFACQIPSALKLKPKQLRYFFKTALKDFLPSEVLTKTKHGFGLPFGVWMRHDKRLQELAGDSLNALAKRGYFRQTFLDKAIDAHRSGHAAYYGEHVWILMMLEQWLHSHRH